MTMLNSTSQCRTMTYVYFFKAKTESTLVLKIYDLSQKCISKTTLSFSQLGLSKTTFTLTDPSTLLEILHQKQLIPSEASHTTPTVEDCLKDIEHVVAQVKPKVVFENKELEKFCCPITLEVFKNPVMDNHGHTFERNAIEAHRRQKNECPINRAPIDSLTPNRAIQQVIEEAQRQDPISTFALFKKQNPQLAASSLKMAQAFMDAEEYDEALDAYTKAFQYTKEWTDYEQLPALFERMGQKDKARLVHLYLIQYQLQGKKVVEALQTLEHCRKIYPDLTQIIPFLVKLYRLTQQPTKAITCALDNGAVLAQEHPQEAILLYRELLAEDPCQWKAYLLLAELLKDPQEKSHILLKGACHALQKKDYNIARSLCVQAQLCYEDSFIDRLIDLDLLAKQGISTEKKLLAIALIYERKHLPSLLIKAYRMLAQLKYDPSYYENIIRGYDQIQKPEKALQWTLRWLTLLIDGHEWQQAEAVSCRALQRTQHHKIPLYEQQELIYTHWQGHKLNELWGKLGQAYVQNGQLAQAEKTYQKAFNQFNTFEHATALAETLVQQDKRALGVQTYYRASSLALLSNRLEDLSLCVRSIRQIDPEMTHLKLSQRMILLTQSRLLELSTEVKLLKERIPPKILSYTASMTILETQTSVIPSFVFGNQAWATYFGDVGAEPPLPPDILQRLPELRKNHVLVLIPETVNGQPLTLKTLGELVQKHLQGHAAKYRHCELGEYVDQPTPRSHWALLTRTVIEGSRNKRCQDEQAIVAAYSQKTKMAYEIPTVLDAAICNFMEYVRTGTWLYSDNPSTFTWCQEEYRANY